MSTVCVAIRVKIKERAHRRMSENEWQKSHCCVYHSISILLISFILNIIKGEHTTKYNLRITTECPRHYRKSSHTFILKSVLNNLLTVVSFCRTIQPTKLASIGLT